jgi:hypothetical protein
MKVILGISVILINFFIFSQDESSKETPVNHFDKFTFEAIKDLHGEVFLNEGYSVLNKEMYSIYENRLERFLYTKKTSMSFKNNLKLLSQVPLLNKVNSDLVYDKNFFDVKKFNPLKYGFMFYENYDQYFLVDGTDFVILLKAFKK